MKSCLIELIVSVVLCQISLAGGSIGWVDVKAKIAKTDPGLVKVIERSFDVAPSGGGVRLGPRFGDRQGERISPFTFEAVDTTTGEKCVLVIEESDDFAQTGRFTFMIEKPEQDVKPEPEPVTKAAAIEASREYRIALKMIHSVHSDLMDVDLTANPADGVKMTEKTKGEYREAREHLERSIALNPYSPEAYVFLANSYWEIENDLPRTVELYGKAVDLDPDFDEVISARGHVHVLLKRPEEARKDLARLEELKSEFAAGLREEIDEFAKGTADDDGKPEIDSP